jgi:hypothetical protein
MDITTNIPQASLSLFSYPQNMNKEYFDSNYAHNLRENKAQVTGAVSQSVEEASLIYLSNIIF